MHTSVWLQRNIGQLGKVGQDAPLREIAIPLHLAITLENKNFELAKWSCISSCLSDYNAVATDAKPALGYSQ